MAKKSQRRGRPNGGGSSSTTITSRIVEVARLRDQNKSGAQISESTGINSASLNQRVIPALNNLRLVTKILALHNQADFNTTQIALILTVQESFVEFVIGDYHRNVDQWIA